MLNEQFVADVTREVVARLQQQLGGTAPAPPRDTPFRSAPPVTIGHGVYRTVDEAVRAADRAHRALAAMDLGRRGQVVDVIRRLCELHAEELAP
jgi:acyl-CoA reductase-like NAD-dependent aldehyde dehydrogenase